MKLDSAKYLTPFSVAYMINPEIKDIRLVSMQQKLNWEKSALCRLRVFQWHILLRYTIESSLHLKYTFLQLVR